jgi:hypothetical protein
MTASSIYFQSFPYAINPSSHLIDYQALAAQAKIFKPRLIICGASAYPRDWEYAELKTICEKEGAWLMADIAHTSGLVAAQELNDPFEYCDVVTTTTCVCSQSQGTLLNIFVSIGTRRFVVLARVLFSSGKISLMLKIWKSASMKPSSRHAKEDPITMYAFPFQLIALANTSSH